MGSQNMGNIVSDLAPAYDQAIMLTNTDILSWHIVNKSSDIWKKPQQASWKKIQNNLRCWSFCLGLNALSSERLESNVR